MVNFSSRQSPTPPTPPSGGGAQDFSDGLSVCGRSKKNNFLSESDVFNEIRWFLSVDKVPSCYKIFRDGVLIATIPARDKPVFQDHNLKGGRTYEYVVVAEDESGFIANGGYAIKTKK